MLSSRQKPRISRFAPASERRMVCIKFYSWLWSAIRFKIMARYTCGFIPRILAIIPPTRYTCVFLPRILAFFPALWGFYSQVYDHFLTNAHIYARKKANIYAFYKQACVCRVTESRSIRGTELDRQQKTPSCMKELKSNFSLNQAWPLSSKVSYSLPSQQWWLLAPRQRISWNPWIVSWETVFAISRMLT